MPVDDIITEFQQEGVVEMVAYESLYGFVNNSFIRRTVGTNQFINLFNASWLNSGINVSDLDQSYSMDEGQYPENPNPQKTTPSTNNIKERFWR